MSLYGSKHKVWLPFLSADELEDYHKHMSARRWLFGRMKHHEDEIARLEVKGRTRRGVVSRQREAAE